MARNDDPGQIAFGMVLVAFLHFVAFWLYFGGLYVAGWLSSIWPNPVLSGFLSNYMWIWPIFAVGVFQVIYVVPVLLWMGYRRRRWGIVKGMVIGAVVTALLNGGCFMVIR
jgi:hypothetical protein